MKKTFTSWLLTVMAVVMFGFTSAAQVLEVQSPVTITGDDVVNVPVKLNNPEAITAVQMTVKATAGIEIGEPIPTSRISDSFVINLAANGALTIINFDLSEIAAADGDATLFYLPVSKAKGSSITTGTINLTNGKYNPVVTDGVAKTVAFNDAQIVCNFKSGDYRATLSTVESLELKAGQSETIAIDLTNNFVVSDVSFTFTLPEGLTLKSTQLTKSNRCNKATQVSCKLVDDHYNVVITNMFDAAINGNSGPIVYLNVEAGENLAAESEIAWTNIKFSINGTSDILDQEPFTTKVVNAQAIIDAQYEAAEEAEATVEALKEALEDAVAEIAENYGEEYVDTDLVDYIKAEIDELAAAVEAAKAAIAETGVFESPITDELIANLQSEVYGVEVMADVEKTNAALTALTQELYAVEDEAGEYLNEDAAAEIAQKITGLFGEVQNALEAWSANQGEQGFVNPVTEETIAAIKAEIEALAAEAIAAAVAEDDELVATWNEGIEGVKAEYPFIENVKKEEIAAVEAQIAEVTAAIAEAKANAEENRAAYNSPVTAEKQDEITTAVMGIITEAGAMVAEIENAYAEDAAQIEEWADTLDGQVDEFPVIATTEEFAAAVALINEAGQSVQDAAQAALVETGVYESPLTAEVTSEITDAVLGVVTQAAAMITEIENAANEDLDQVQEWSDTLEGLGEEFPAFAEANVEKIEALNAELEAVAGQIEEAVEVAALETGVYESPITGEKQTEITDAIMGLVSQQAEELAAIEVPYEEDMELLNTYIEEAKKYIDAEVSEEIQDKALQLYGTAIDEVMAAAIAYNEALNESGVYESPVTDEVKAQLAELLNEIETGLSGINGIAADANGAEYYDLNGVKVAEPATGKVYIKVANGKAAKVVVE